MELEDEFLYRKISVALVVNVDNLPLSSLFTMKLRFYIVNLIQIQLINLMKTLF